MKRCSNCKTIKPFTDFSKNKTEKSGFQSHCKGCEKAKYSKAKQHKILLAKKWYQDNKVKKAEYDKIRRRIKAESLKQYEKARLHLPHRKELRRQMTAIRRATIKNRIPSWFGEFDKFVSREAAELAFLRKASTQIEWHIDHVEPLHGKYVSGLHNGWNLQVIPATENLVANNRPKRQFFAGL